MDPHLKMRREIRGTSGVVAVPSVFFSNGERYVVEVLEVHQGCKGPFQGSRGKVGFLSRRRSRKGPHLALRGESGFSQVLGENLGFLSIYDGELRDPLVLPKESPVSLCVARVTQDSSPVAAGY